MSHPLRRMAQALACLALTWLFLAQAASAEEPTPKVIQDGSTVSLEYTLKLDDGTTADSNVGQEPLKYVQGSGQIPSALQRELAGMKVNDTKQGTLSPEEGPYGAVDPEAFQEVDASMVPEGSRKAGAQLVAQDGSGRQRVVRVMEVTESGRARLDLNHPLAGKKLHFDVRVVAID